MSITVFYAGLLGLWFLVLSLRVVQGRANGPSLGDGGDNGMQRRIRAHANFAEYVPLVLLLMGLLEAGGIRGWLMHVFGIALLVGRLLHGYALAYTQHFKFGRMIGTLLTFIVLAAAALLSIWRGLAGAWL